MPGEDEVQVLVHADISKNGDEGGYLDPDETANAGSLLR